MTSPSAPPTRASLIQSQFASFRTYLDASNDKRERLIKASRDITALSKKLIFHLHRVALVRAPQKRAQQLEEARGKQLEEILGVWRERVGVEWEEGEEEKGEGEREEGKGRPEVQWKYARAVQGGLEEFIEAVSFLHYLQTSSLLTLTQLRELLTSSPTPSSSPAPKPILDVSPAAYALGLADLTGELMRLSINAIGKGDHDAARSACAFVRELKEEFDPLQPYVRDLRKKMDVMEASLRKIEDASYTVAVRGAEYRDKPEMLQEVIRRLGAEVEVGGD